MNIHLHTAVGHGHGVVRHGIARHLAVVGAADGGKRAHVAGVDRLSSPVRPGEVTMTEVVLIPIQQQKKVSNRWTAFLLLDE